MVEILPPKKTDDGNEGGSQNGNHLLINHLHYYANDLAELRKLAEVDPDLAKAVVAQRDEENKRIVGSYNLGLVLAALLLAVTLAALTSLIIFAGIVATLVCAVGLLSCALFMRVILTGEWSDTSWLGKVINYLVKLLGGSTDET
ncbi:hypothetical protein HHL25_14185 [Rhizobium sp. S-51]|uniref:Uncharacterized protein n=1 Tax=Rhizobium terricola TaxID=2728849 RepID=A0A7Y0AXJ0_9HYPH|nr:hypothetical protein [Rhizobium terricola]NML75276.1 hypothetical protein [Rhizobium terricola]